MSPVYVWKCPKCGLVDDVLQTGFDPKQVRCEACQIDMQLQLVPLVVVYKGEGFAKKDRSKEAT